MAGFGQFDHEESYRAETDGLILGRRQGFQAGSEEGYTQGYENGRIDGWNDAANQMRPRFDELTAQNNDLRQQLANALAALSEAKRAEVQMDRAIHNAQQEIADLNHHSNQMEEAARTWKKVHLTLAPMLLPALNLASRAAPELRQGFVKEFYHLFKQLKDNNEVTEVPWHEPFIMKNMPGIGTRMKHLLEGHLLQMQSQEIETPAQISKSAQG